MKALMAGFDAISNHIGLIVFSLMLDLFLWLGPHFRLVAMMRSFFDWAEALPGMEAPDMALMMRSNQELILQAIERLNLFSALRTLPIGIPSLMVSRSPMAGPVGTPMVWEVPSPWVAFGLWLGMIALGIIIGTLYFETIAQAALDGKVRLRAAVTDWSWSFRQVVNLCLFWLGLLLILSLPFSCMVSFLLAGSLSAGRVAFLVYGGLVAWMIFPLIFSPHGIFVNRRPMWTSVKDGVRLTRLTFPTTGLFILLALVLSEGLDVLWKIPPESSWLTLVGIIAHSFVTAGILAASFIYYRDADQWVQRMAQHAKLMALKRGRNS
jgi:hypothetical protein